MNRSALAQQLDVAVTVHANDRGVPRKDVIGTLKTEAGVARSTIRQDLAGHIKRPAPHRLTAYSRVLGCPMGVLLQAAESDGISYDFTAKERDSARSPSDLEYSGTTEGEWSKPTWSDWQQELGIDSSWSEASQDDRARVANSTLFGSTDADTFGDANFYPLVEPGGGLNANALDSAWKLAGRAPDPEGVRRTVESLANDEFDMSFTDDESALHTFASPEDITTGDKVGWSTSSDSINTYGTVRKVHTDEGDISPPDSDYTLNSDDAPVFRTEVYDVDEGEHTGTETIHRASELTPMDSFPDGDKEAPSQAPFIQTNDPMDGLKSTFEQGATKQVQPFTDKVNEDDTEFKGSAEAQVKDVDRNSNVVTGYYAAWSWDSMDERFEEGAWEEAIKKYGPQADKQRIVQLNQHLTKQPVGRPITLKEDKHGLYFETVIADTRKGRDVLALYNEGVITEHSVGFQRQEEREKDDGGTVIEKALLLEGSNVTWGANSDTPFTGFKSGKHAIEELVNYMSNLKSALREDLTQTTARKVEHGLDAVESELRRLIDVAGDLAEQAEDANADPIQKGDLDTAVRSFKEQMGAIEDGNETNWRNRKDGDGIDVPDFSGGEKTDDTDVSDLIPDTDFFGRNA